MCLSSFLEGSIKRLIEPRESVLMSFIRMIILGFCYAVSARLCYLHYLRTLMKERSHYNVLATINVPNYVI